MAWMLKFWSTVPTLGPIVTWNYSTLRVPHDFPSPPPPPTPGTPKPRQSASGLLS